MTRKTVEAPLAQLTTAQAAAQIGVSVRRVQQWIAQGRLAAIRPGRDHLVDPISVARLAAEERRPGRPKVKAG